MAPKMAPNRRRRRSERQSASHVTTALRWFAEMPEGPCRVALAGLMEELLARGESEEAALEQGIALAARLFPEEIVLWNIDGAPWQDVDFQRDVRAAAVHLREMRQQYIDLVQENEGHIEELRLLRASLQMVESPEQAQSPVTTQPPADFVPFSGTGHILGADDLSG